MITYWGSRMKENHTKEKKQRKFIKWVNNMIMLHPIWVTIIISAVLFGGAFILRLVLWVLNNCLQGYTDNRFVFVQAEQGIETWFSFFGSYFGVIATVVLGIITLRLTIKMGQKEQVAKFQNLKISEMYLYDMFADFAPSQLKHGKKNYQFLLKIILVGHAPEYELGVADVRWSECGKKYEPGEEKELPDCEIYVDKADKPIIYIYFNDFKDCGDRQESRKTISYFYHINRYEPLMMERHFRCRWLRIDMFMKERIWKKGQAPEVFSADFRVLFENGYKRKDCVELHEIEHNMEIKDR